MDNRHDLPELTLAVQSLSQLVNSKGDSVQD